MNIKPGSQNARLLLHLAKGQPLTRVKALIGYNVQNFQARMSDLKEVCDGLDMTLDTHDNGPGYIEKTIKTDPQGQTFASYKIVCRGCRKAAGRYLNSIKRPRSKTVRAA